MTRNGMMTREKFLQLAPKRRYVVKEVAGHTWRLRSLNDREFTRVGASEQGESTVSLIIECVCDSNGDPLFTEADREFWHNQDAFLVQDLADACLTHVGNHTEEAAKNG